MVMSTATMTEKQRMALEALHSAKRESKTLTDYAKAHGLEIRELYDSLACLRRRGLLPPGGRRKPRSRFVAVRVAAETTPSRAAGAVCRVVSRDGYVIECAQWPPASWLASLARSAADAAT
jgi:hypothetical protein